MVCAEDVWRAVLFVRGMPSDACHQLAESALASLRAQSGASNGGRQSPDQVAELASLQDENVQLNARLEEERRAKAEESARLHQEIERLQESAVEPQQLETEVERAVEWAKGAMGNARIAR